MPHTEPEPGLAQRLKVATASLHRRAERSGVMADLLARRISQAAYVSLVAELLAVYESLEAALDIHRDSPALAGLWHEALRRAPALAQDALYFGAAPARAVATADYRRRIAAASAGAPHRLVAHAYVRYLGDLHGGQTLSALLRERFSLSGEDGLRFYDFGPLTAVVALRESFRGSLGRLPLSAAQADDVITEGCWAFEAHIRLFEEIASQHDEAPAAPGAPSASG